MYDLVLSNGRVVDPGQGVDAVTDLAFAHGKVAALGQGLAARGAREVHDVAGKLVVPGLIDIHAHVLVPLHRDFDVISVTGSVQMQGARVMD